MKTNRIVRERGETRRWAMAERLLPSFRTETTIPL